MTEKLKKDIEDMRNVDEELINKNKEIITETQEKGIIGNIEKIPENEYEQESKWAKFFKGLLQLIVFGTIALVMIYIQNIRTPENKSLTTWLTLSILANIMIIFLSLLTGTGIQLAKRFINRFRYKSGKFVNSLLILKSGVIKEVFVQKDQLTGSFRIMGKPYITNAKLMFNYKGMPSYLHREDNPDPVNVWQEGYARELSCSEMDTVMASMDSFNAIEWLKGIVNYAAIGLAIVVAIGGFSGNMIYNDHKALTETGDYLPPKNGVICKMIVPVAQTDKTIVTEIQGQTNSTGEEPLPQQDLR